ncbi:DUF2314 domain-containing protein [Massilia atriviolacea]|uniref:DUF2314 domain-containing protein n=1 Tax=Massilia atriviolacea TaxID=2495579 RepID=A0A430HNM6_9BURK|nr:DUF2314 domain-containing protein [Massilia atriviolacea]RSZ59091.1 DUF2314 domain-containing protein [Massilia atriviolacea]
MSQDDLLPLFAPPLSLLLESAEDAKNSPLNEVDVLEIRDAAAVIMMSRDDFNAMAQTRGDDIDPENCWYDWQMLRRRLGRKPDLDPGAKVVFIGNDDEAFRKTITLARESLSVFRAMLADASAPQRYPLVKVRLEEPGYHANIWLLVVAHDGHGFVGRIFELPGDFTQYAVGMELTVPDSDVQDWMINDDGTLYGGYSLRYSRAAMGEAEQIAFDRHLGVSAYA